MPSESESVPPKPGDRAPEVTLPLESGGSYRLAEGWSQSERGLALLLLRHFGCMFCREQVKAFRDRFSEITARGVTLIAVGNGTPRRAARFQAELELPFLVLGDREAVAYEAFGVGRAPLSDLLRPGLYRAGLRALAGGNLPRPPQGDASQLPGAFLVDPDGIVRWAQRASHAGDTATVDAVLAAIDRLPPSTG
jgi:peroxiredoxin